MLAWLFTSSLVCAGLDAPAQTVEIAPEVRAVLDTAAPEALVDRLRAMGAPALSAAWAIELGLSNDPRGPQDENAVDLWPTLLDEAELDPFLAALQATLPHDAETASLRLAVQRLSHRANPKVVPVLATLVNRLPAASLQSQRSSAWVVDALGTFGDDHEAVQDALERNSDRFPASLQAGVDLALLASGSSAPLGRWRADRMEPRELVQRLEGLRRLRPGFEGTRDVITALEALLGHTDGLVRTRTAQAVATLGATELVQGLVELTDDADRRVQRAATASLVELSGIRWPESADAWRTWWSGELSWIDSSLPDLIDDLHGEEPERRVRAVQQILEHRAAAHITAAVLGEACWDGADEAFCVRIVQCLAALRGPSALGALRLASQDTRFRVREAALSSLSPETGGHR